MSPEFVVSQKFQGFQGEIFRCWFHGKTDNLPLKIDGWKTFDFFLGEESAWFSRVKC